MTDVILSPIPYNGGSISLTNVNSHICRLSSNLFIAVFGQSSPNYTFAATYTATDLKSSSTITNKKQRLLRQTSCGRARLWRLNDTTALCLLNSNLIVLSVLPDGDVIESQANIPSYHTNLLWDGESQSAYGAGPYICGMNVKDNEVWFIKRAPGATSNISLVKVTYDESGQTLTETAIRNLVISAPQANQYRPSIRRIANSTDVLVYLSTPGATPNMGVAYRITTSGATIQTIGSVPPAVKEIAYLTPTRIIGVTSQSNWLYFDGTTWSSNYTQFSTSSSGMAVISHLEPLNEDYFMITTSGNNSSFDYTQQTFYIRIVKFVDPLIGQTSTPTNTAATNGISCYVPNLYFDQPLMEKVDSELYLSYGRASQNAFRIKTFCKKA